MAHNYSLSMGARTVMNGRVHSPSFVNTGPFPQNPFTIIGAQLEPRPYTQRGREGAELKVFSDRGPGKYRCVA
jgi:hypothetical protein